MSGERASVLRPPDFTTFGVAEQMIQTAREHERRARYYRSLAARVRNPGDGVRVEVDRLHGQIRVVGPPMEVGRGN